MRLLLALLCCGALCASAQNPRLPVILNPQPPEGLSKIDLPFSAVKVIDVRFDRSNVGCVNNSVSRDGRKHFKTMAVLPDSFERYLPKLLQQVVSLNAPSSDTLVLLVKQFRLTDYILNGVNQALEPASMLKLSASFFRLQNGLLTKLFSVNDVFSEPWAQDQKLKKEFLEASREQSLLSLLQKVFAKGQWQASGVSFALQQVTESIPRRYALPALTDSVLVSGVYANFQEFKNNKPSLTNVKFSYRSNRVESVSDEKGDRVLMRKIWGVCDGRKRYIVFHGELCELVPSDKSFRFLSYSSSADLAGNPSYGDYATQAGLGGAALIKAQQNVVNREYFFLNMDDEDVYLEEVFGKSKLAKMHRELLK